MRVGGQGCTMGATEETGGHRVNGPAPAPKGVLSMQDESNQAGLYIQPEPVCRAHDGGES
jgi:hypothetical protein